MSIIKDLRHALFYRLLTNPKKGLVLLGDECSWTILPDPITAKSIVLSAGAGHDISFEKALSERFGCRILLLDPSPTGRMTWQKFGADLPTTEFLPSALSDHDGWISLGDPLDAEEGSFRSASLHPASTLKVPSRSIKAICAERSWERIDLLKMDIEGAEYDVVESLLADGISIGQICVEFHHGAGFSTSRSDTIRTILMLRKAGYRLVHRIHWDHTFVHRTLL